MEQPLTQQKSMIEYTKEEFIDFILDLVEPEMKQALFNYLSSNWTTSMTPQFFSSFWHGSFNFLTEYDQDGNELPSILDDIDIYIAALKNFK